jgi:L-threonylcarbamoyladenylate synthase
MQLLDGKILAFPTVSCWALDCDPENEAATLRLLASKEHHVEIELILLAGSIPQVEHLLDGLTSKQRSSLVASWPGRAAWLIPDIYDQVPTWIKGADGSVAVRVSAHPLARALCLAFAGPIVSSPAKRGTDVLARSALQVVKHLGKDIDGVLHGKAGRPTSLPTTMDA